MHGAIGGAYRSQGITTLELRFNPMKRNRGGERDLDHIILAAIRGLDRRRARVPAGQGRPDPDDGPDVLVDGAGLLIRMELVKDKKTKEPLPRRVTERIFTEAVQARAC